MDIILFEVRSVNMKNKTRISNFVSIGSCIGLCAAVGVVLGGMLGKMYRCGFRQVPGWAWF